jgi:hypothetical protein
MAGHFTKLTTRASNARKHPGIPDQAKKKRSPAQMAALRASEKAANDAKAAAALAASVTIAGIEDSMVIDDKNDDDNAARPIPAGIPRVHQPIRRTHSSANLVRDLELEEVEMPEGESSVVVAPSHPFLKLANCRRGR